MGNGQGGLKHAGGGPGSKARACGRPTSEIRRCAALRSSMGSCAASLMSPPVSTTTNSARAQAMHAHLSSRMVGRAKSLPYSTGHTCSLQHAGTRNSGPV
jgi:hypothetical protein